VKEIDPDSDVADLLVTPTRFFSAQPRGELASWFPPPFSDEEIHLLAFAGVHILDVIALTTQVQKH
jgi:hypothetical protein